MSSVVLVMSKNVLHVTLNTIRTTKISVNLVKSVNVKIAKLILMEKIVINVYLV